MAASSQGRYELVNKFKKAKIKRTNPDFEKEN